VKFGGLLGLAMGWQSCGVLGGIRLAWIAAALTTLIVRRFSRDRSGSRPIGPFLLVGALLPVLPI
jgi:hypothetical protein